MNTYLVICLFLLISRLVDLFSMCAYRCKCRCRCRCLPAYICICMLLELCVHSCVCFVGILRILQHVISALKMMFMFAHCIETLLIALISWSELVRTLKAGLSPKRAEQVRQPTTRLMAMLWPWPFGSGPILL